MILLVVLLSLSGNLNASAVRSCDTIVQVKEKVVCPANVKTCKVHFKSKSIFNQSGHSMGPCDFQGKTFKESIKLPSGKFTFKKGDRITLSYFWVCGEKNCDDPEWTYKK